MRPIARTLTAVTVAAAAGAGLACSNSNNGLDGPDAARVTVLLTDAPANVFKSAVVEIGEIKLLPGDGEEAIALTENGGTFDLLDLQNGVTANLANLEIEPGFYRQLRLVVLSAEVTLDDTVFFRDGSQTKTLKIPSGAQSGIKVNLGFGSGDGDQEPAGIEITQGETIIVVDFDVSQNFRLQGSLQGNAGFHGVIFTPMLRAVVRNVAGSISGEVTLEGSGDPVDGATVRATLLDAGTIEELETAEVTALTNADGDYTIRFLAPGVYQVSVDDFSAAPDTVTVGAGENVTGIDFSGTF
jgi:hypothetical protein